MLTWNDLLLGADEKTETNTQAGIEILNRLEENIQTGRRCRLHLLGLGDVGGITLIGLRLAGGHVFSEIGIYDLDPCRMKRWEAEINQVYNAGLGGSRFPKVVQLKEEDLFDCDIFAFCASRNVPEVGADVSDVRKIQLEGNSAILDALVEKALDRSYKGLLAVISDPVDQLCMRALKKSDGQMAPDQIKGFGLGVMYARARYLAAEAGLDPELVDVFGPHGQGLIVANSAHPEVYDDELSMELTRKTETFNMKMRSWGYKPYIAPALSSAALSLVAMAEGLEHHSTVYLDGVYLGVANKLTGGRFVPRRYALAEGLKRRLKETITGLSTE